MTKIIKLIHDKNQNDYTFYGFQETDKINNNYEEIITQSLREIGDYDRNRKLTIYTYGEKNTNHKKPKCQVIFDVSSFATKIEKTDIKKYDGRDQIIQNAIIQHPIFDILIENVINEIEKDNLNTISFVCNHGKHRSVGWAEILKKYYYKFSKVVHIKFKNY